MTFPLELVGRAVVDNSFHASALIGCVLLLRRMLGRRLPAQCFHLLWLLVALRLLAPIAPQSSWSVFHLLQPRTPEEEARDTPAWRTYTITTAARASHFAALPMANPAPVSTAKRVAHLSWTTCLALLWLAGVGGQIAYLTIGGIQSGRQWRGAPAVRDRWSMELAQAAAAEMGLKVAPRIYESEHIPGPALLGLWRPRVIVPRGLREKLSDEEYAVVLRHECAHLRRRDLVTLWIFTSARIVHWFNPLVWVAVRLGRIDLELACDEAVLRRERSVDLYGETLLKLARTWAGDRSMPAALGIVQSKKILAERIGRIGAYAPRTFLRNWLPASVIITCAAGGFGADAPDKTPSRASAQPTPLPTEPKPEHFFTQTRITPAKIPPVEAGGAEGWAIMHVTVPKSGKIAAGLATLRSPEGRVVQLSSGRQSKEGLLLASLEWSGRPLRVKANVVKDGIHSTLGADAAMVSHDDFLTPQALQVEVASRFYEVDAATVQTLRRLDPGDREIRFKPGTRPASFAAVISDDLPPEVANPTWRINPPSRAKIESKIAKNVQDLTSKTGQQGLTMTSAPRVTTKSGQLATIEMIREVRYPTSFKSERVGKETRWVGENFETRLVGAMIEVEAVLGEDDWIPVKIAPQVVELLGSVDFSTREKLWEAPIRDSQSMLDWIFQQADFKPSPRGAVPVFSTHKASAEVALRNGDSLLLVGLPEIEEIKPFGERKDGKTLVVVVTLQEIDWKGRPARNGVIIPQR